MVDDLCAIGVGDYATCLVQSEILCLFYLISFTACVQEINVHAIGMPATGAGTHGGKLKKNYKYN